MTKEQIGGIARAVASAIGGLLVGKGYIDQEMAVSLAGAVATVVVAVWSVWAKRSA